MILTQGKLWRWGRRACWAVYILTGQRAGKTRSPAMMRLRLADCRRYLCPDWNGTSDRLNMAMVNPAGWAGGAILSQRCLLSLEMIALTPAHTHFWYAHEHGARAGRHLRNGLSVETLTLVQTLALCSIIAASMGSLTMRPEPKWKK